MTNKTRHRIGSADSLADLAEIIRKRIWFSLENDGPAIRQLTGSIVHNVQSVFEDHKGKKHLVIPFHDFVTKPALSPNAVQCKEHDQMCELKRIYAWARLNMRYLPDITELDTYANHLYTTRIRGGDCDDYTTLIASMCKSIGMECYARIVSTHDDPWGWTHIYPVAVVHKGNKVLHVPVDLTIKGPLGREYNDIAAEMNFPMFRKGKIRRGQFQPKWRIPRPPEPKD